ncbi:MAG TPA: caspase family protein [Chitinophagaceae bacterium]|nr:caspase family protein [Chitinophagaceae bacterium]
MRNCFLIISLFINCFAGFSQINSPNASPQQTAVSSNTYAIVVGISQYESTVITQLDYADRDAKVFASYLESKAGGSVPPENIRLLTNESATFAAVYDAMNWLLETCQKGDMVYFYFSGHGDMENNTIYKLGFLLTYNTPRFNYLNNAVRLEDLNNFANTLSVQRQARVVLITDACHSGNLAGNEFRGSLLVGDQLRTVQGNEVRITSCGPDELSNEDEGWGGGRGVFSYYLVNGMIGLADNLNNGVVTVKEIGNYLDSSLSKDILLAQKNQKQTPVINGPSNFRLASVNKTSLDSLKQRFFSAAGLQRSQPSIFLKPLPVPPLGYLFGLIGKKNIEELVDFNKLDQLSKEEIPLAFIKMLVDTLQKQSAFQTADSLKVDIGKIDQLEKSFDQNPDALKRFDDKLVVALSDRGQEIINLYLTGDAAELEKRQYYNVNSSGYDIYPKMFSVALKLADPQSPIYHILLVKLHYFSGVVARLKIPTVEDPKPLLDLAMAEQQKAFQLEENAAYIQNELGVLSELKKNYAAAEKYFFRATQIAPTWAIPWANMCGLYALEKKFDKGLETAHIADSLQPDLQGTHVNLGVLNENSGNLLFAEEDYRKSIDINSRHYLPFERLGYVYMNTTKYAQADSFFYEADKRKKGFHFEGNGWAVVASPIVLPAVVGPHCEVDTSILKKDDIMAFFTYALQQYQVRDYKTAVRFFKKVIALDKTNPLVFHYMGKIFFDQQQWEDAELMFKFAIDCHLSDSSLGLYCDSVIKKVKYPYPHDCFENFFRESQYDDIEDYFFIATVYESWSHYEEAETYLRKVIKMRPFYMGGYVKLWQMQERTERYTEAEATIKSFAVQDRESSDRELNAFYRRMIQRFPTNGDWYYRLGLLLYPRAERPSRAPYFDTIVHFPVLNQEKFIDFDIYSKLTNDPTLFIGDKNDPSSPQNIQLGMIREFSESLEIPGTKEQISLAEPIYTPRKDAIEFLLKAADLFTETKTVADIYFKVGNVFVWAGSNKQAYPNYAKSIQMDPENAATRLRIIDVCKSIYKNRAALENLDYLYDNKKINFPDRLLLGEFSIYSGQFDKAKKILAEAVSIYPYMLPGIADLNGRLELLSKNPVKALPYYQDFLSSNPDNFSVMYTIAKLYAQMKNEKEAWQWLQLSIDKGFHYYWILKLDTTWDDYRSKNKWKEMTGKINPIDYDKVKH